MSRIEQCLQVSLYMRELSMGREGRDERVCGQADQLSRQWMTREKSKGARAGGRDE